MAEKQYINPKNPVYFSYYKADDKCSDIEESVKKICAVLDTNGICYKRNSDSDIPYCASLDEIQRETGRGALVIVIISKGYIGSLDCMHEWHRIRENGKIWERVLPVVMPDANILDKVVFRRYYDYFTQRRSELTDQQNEGIIPLTKVETNAAEFGYYVEDLGKMYQYLADTNFVFNDFSAVVNRIKELLTNKETQQQPFKPTIDLSSPVLNYRRDVSGLIARTKLTGELYNQLQDNQFVNMTGIGGMGKTSLSYLFVNEYADKYNKIAYVLVNNDFYEELDKEFGRFFGIKRNVKVELTFDGNRLDDVQKDNLPFLNKLISSFENISGQNLLIIDVNESANYQQVSEAIDVMRRRGMKNWKVLIIARVKIFSNVVEFTPFEIGGCDLKVAKSIFFNYLKDKDKSKDYQYSDDDFMDLFDTLFYSPLLIEQLAKYLLRNRSRLSKESILNYIKGDGKEYGLQQQRLNSGTIDEQRLAKYEIINIFLSHLSEFSELDAMYKKDNQLRDIVRHMMLWKADYYSIDTIFTFVKGLIVSADVLREALDCLCDLCVLDYSDTENGYKMHGLMAKTFRKQVLEDVANSDFRDYSQYFKNIIELGYIKDDKSPITKRIYATLDDDDFMEKYYWKTLKPKPITEELIEEYNMVKVEGHDFYICKYAVTQGDWKKIYKDPNDNPSYFKKGDNYPVEQVSWYDAMLYIMKLNNETGLCFRLPSAKQWEWACKYSKAHKRNVDNVAWHYMNSGKSTHPVEKTPTPISDEEDYGIKNMLGNVWEWCSDWYSKGGSCRVYRGGSWGNDAGIASSSSRDRYHPNSRRSYLGFRLALQLKK